MAGGDDTVCLNKGNYMCVSMETDQVTECLKQLPTTGDNRQRARPGPNCGAMPDGAISVAPLCNKREDSPTSL